MCKGKFNITSGSNAMQSPSLAWDQVKMCEENCPMYSKCQYVADMQDTFNTDSNTYPYNSNITFNMSNDSHVEYTDKELGQVLRKMDKIKFYMNTILHELAFQNKNNPRIINPNMKVLHTVDKVRSIEIDLSSADDEFYIMDKEGNVLYVIEFVTQDVAIMNDKDFNSDLTCTEQKDYELGKVFSYYTVIQGSNYAFREL